MGSTVSHVLTVVACMLLITGAGAQEKVARDYECIIEPRSLVKLGSADEGLIREISVERGDTVRKGDVVGKLDSDLQELQVALAKVKAEREVEIESGEARRVFRELAAERAEKLSEREIISGKMLEEARTERLLAELGVKAAELDQERARMELKNARKLLERRTIRSPVDGVVSEVMMAPGEFAHKQSEIMTIAEVDPLNVEVFVPIAEYGKVKIGMMGEVVPEDPIGGKYVAEVKIVDRVFDTASSTFGVRLSLPNPEFVLPAGLKCRVEFLDVP